MTALTLTEILHPEKQLLDSYVRPTAARSYHPDFPDVSFETARTVGMRKEQLLCKMQNAIDGILKGERYYKKQHPSAEGTFLSQSDFLQLPLLIAETYPHGFAALEILNSWEYFVPKHFPEARAAAIVKKGCPIHLLGSFQLLPDEHLRTVERTQLWALLYAGYPQKAVNKAFLDAALTADKTVVEAALFFTAAIAFAFTRSPKEAVSAAIYGMSLPYVERTIGSSIRTLQQCMQPIEHCILLFHAVQNSNTMEECFRLLETHRAEACCYFAAGAIFGANADLPMEKEDTALSGILNYGGIVSKQDLAIRYTERNPGIAQKKLPWDNEARE